MLDSGFSLSMPGGVTEPLVMDVLLLLGIKN